MRELQEGLLGQPPLLENIEDAALQPPTTPVEAAEASENEPGGKLAFAVDYGDVVLGLSTPGSEIPSDPDHIEVHPGLEYDPATFAELGSEVAEAAEPDTVADEEVRIVLPHVEFTVVEVEPKVEEAEETPAAAAQPVEQPVEEPVATEVDRPAAEQPAETEATNPAEQVETPAPVETPPAEPVAPEVSQPEAAPEAPAAASGGGGGAQPPETPTPSETPADGGSPGEEPHSERRAERHDVPETAAPVETGPELSESEELSEGGYDAGYEAMLVTAQAEVVLSTYPDTAALVSIAGGVPPSPELQAGYTAYLTALQHPLNPATFEAIIDPGLNAHDSIPQLPGQPPRPEGTSDYSALQNFRTDVETTSEFIGIQDGRWHTRAEITDVTGGETDLDGVVGSHFRTFTDQMTAAPCSPSK